MLFELLKRLLVSLGGEPIEVGEHLVGLLKAVQHLRLSLEDSDHILLIDHREK